MLNLPVDAVDIVKPEPIKTPEISDTVQGIKFIEETNIKEEIENSDETSIITRVKSNNWRYFIQGSAQARSGELIKTMMLMKILQGRWCLNMILQVKSL